MKKRISAILLCLTLIVGLLPTTALAAVSDSWDLNLAVSEDTGEDLYNGQHVLKIDFNVQSDNLKLRKAQSITFAIDPELFDFVKYPDDKYEKDEVTLTKEFSKAENAVAEGAKTQGGKSPKYWSVSMYYAKSSTTTYV